MTIETIFRFQIKQGNEQSFERIANTMATDVKENEPGTVSFRFIRDTDSGQVVFHDVFENADAFVQHVGRMKQGGHLADLMETVEVQGVYLLGDITPAARNVASEFNAVCCEDTIGFSREATLTV